MNQTTNEENPLQEFSGCHETIMENFQQLEQLLDLIHQQPSKQIVRMAKQLIAFFDDVVLTHHEEEEKELFTAVLEAGDENEDKQLAREQIRRLVDEHRQLEALWESIEQDMRLLAKGRKASLDVEVAKKLTRDYLAHAEFEEQVFLPLAATMLKKNDLSALGLSLHLRHQQIKLPDYI